MEGYHGSDAKAVGTQALAGLQRLSLLVKELLALPYREPRVTPRISKLARACF